MYAALVAVAFILLVCLWLYQQAFETDIGRIKGIPEAPGAVPFYGHLKALGNDHASQFQRWGKENDWEVMQARLGTQRVIVLNSYRAAQEWIVQNQSITIDRPLFWTFANVLSSTQG